MKIIGMARSPVANRCCSSSPLRPGNRTSSTRQLGPSGGGWLSDKVRRQRLVDAARLAFQALSLPAVLVQRAYYRAREPLSGDCLYTLARYRG